MKIQKNTAHRNLTARAMAQFLRTPTDYEHGRVSGMISTLFLLDGCTEAQYDRIKTNAIEIKYAS